MAEQYNPKEIEASVAKKWGAQKKEIKKSMQYDPKKKMFSFLDGPPTANAPPALHHLETRVFKDLVLRYKYMKGFSVPRKGGWDCHGLPVEVQVEKKLGLATKKDVVKFGIENFTKMCRKDVFSHIEEWTGFTEKSAYWVDLENPYVTMDNNYIESVWWSLKELFKKGLLYEGHKVVPYCPRCETPLSSHEVSQGYGEVTVESFTTKFKLKGWPNRFILGWTTTPWTTPANVALAANPKLTYVVVKHGGSEYIVAKGRVSHYFGEKPEISEEFKGNKLDGLEYEPLFDYFVGKLDKPAWKVVMVDYATETDGTGIVHTAPAFGEEDYQTGKKYGLAFIQPVTKDGKFTDDVHDFKGRFVIDCDKDIIRLLESQGKVFSKEKYKHEYPFCWRCKTPLLYYATDSWFIKVSEHRNELVKNNEKINWYPESIKHGRFGNWLAEAKDWALSRTKFWGTPLPIWRCSCGETEAIGSVDELAKKSIKHLPKDLDLHKPRIDEVKLKCKCGKEMQRVPDVIDTWYDSGSAPFAQFHYPFENKEMFQKSFPYDFIAEAVDQTRGWFYTMHVISTLLFGSNAYKSVVSAGHLLDEKGEKMSKSKGNVINPWEIFDAYGVDAARLLMCLSAPGNPKKVGRKTIEEGVMPFLNILWNSFQFTRYVSSLKAKKGKLEIEDKWMMSKTNSLIKIIEKNIEAHEYQECFRAYQDFIVEDLSRWYIKLAKERAEDASVSETLLNVLEIFSKVFAPFAPYFSDYIYSELSKGQKSVHLSSWPKVDEKLIDKKLEEEMEIVKKIVETSNSIRQDNAIKLKYPLYSLTVSGSGKVTEAAKNLKVIIESMANVKQVNIGKEKVEYDAKVNFAVAGKAIGKDVKKLEEALKETDATELKEIFDKKNEAKIKGLTVKKDFLIFREKAGENKFAKPIEGGKVELDAKADDKLKKEWLLRELVRAIQEKRKDIGLQISDKIKIYLSDEFKEFGKQIEEETGSKTIFGKIDGEKSEFDFEGRKYQFGIEKK
ncbi:MAG: isoleucine--tRNA ligase [Candidatus Aenigmatarchaeota archaeon]